MRTTRRRITQSTGARAAAGCAFLVAIALLIPGVTQRFNTAVQWRPSGPFFSPGQVKFDHSANATTEESPPEEAAAAEAAAAQEGGQEVAPVEPIDLAALNEDQLFEALMWWQSSQKIDNPPGDPLYLPAERESYITWEPDIGGLNNIRLQMEMLVILTHLTGRTLVLPDLLAADDLFMMRPPVGLWDFYDFEHLREWIPVISMDQYLDRRFVVADDAVRTDANLLREYLRDGSRHTETAYPKWNSVNQVLAPGGDGTNQEDPTGAHPRLEEWRVMHANPAEVREEVFYGDEERNALTLHFESSQETRLFGSPAFIYLPTAAWLDYYWSKVRDYLHFQPDRMREAARVLVRVLQETGGRFNAIHVRSTDWAQQYPEWYIEPENVAPKALQVLGGESPLYVATDSDNRTALEPIVKAFPQVIFMADLVSEEEVPFNARGIVDQMVCSVAGRFLGTFGSTFSSYISRVRAYHSAALVPDKGVYFTNYPETQDAYENAINNNEWQAGAVWWSRPGVEHFNRELWMRDFVISTEFPTLRLDTAVPDGGGSSEEQPQNPEGGGEEQPQNSEGGGEEQPQNPEGGAEQPQNPESSEQLQNPEGGEQAQNPDLGEQPQEGGDPNPEGGEPQQPAAEEQPAAAEGQPAEAQEGQPQQEGPEGQLESAETVPVEGQEGQPQVEGQPQPEGGQEGQPAEEVQNPEAQNPEGQAQAEGDAQPSPDGETQVAEGGEQQNPDQENAEAQQQNPEGGGEQQPQPEAALVEGQEGQPEAQEGGAQQNPEGGDAQPEAVPVEGQEEQPQNPDEVPVEGQEAQPENPEEQQPAQARRARLSRALRSFLSV